MRPAFRCVRFANAPYLLLLLVAVLAAPTPGGAAPLMYKDKLGRTVTVETPVRRAILFETYELLPAVGGFQGVAGLSRYALQENDLLAARPELLKGIEPVGTAWEMNAEAVLRLKPDLVLTWVADAEAVRFLEARGLKVIAVYIESLPELYEVLRLQGRLLGRERAVEGVIGRMEELFDLIRKRVAGVPAAGRRKALWLSSKPTTVAGNPSLANDLFRLIGVENGASSVAKNSADVPLERILAWNPDLVFLWGNAKYSPKELKENPAWKHVKATAGGSIFKAPRWGTWSPRLAPLALWMAAKAYPERFRDVDVVKRVDEFYRTVYGIPYEKVRPLEP